MLIRGISDFLADSSPVELLHEGEREIQQTKQKKTLMGSYLFGRSLASQLLMKAKSERVMTIRQWQTQMIAKVQCYILKVTVGMFCKI